MCFTKRVLFHPNETTSRSDLQARTHLTALPTRSLGAWAEDSLLLNKMPPEKHFGVPRAHASGFLAHSILETNDFDLGNQGKASDVGEGLWKMLRPRGDRSARCYAFAAVIFKCSQTYDARFQRLLRLGMFLLDVITPPCVR